MIESEPAGSGSYRLFRQGGGKTAFAQVHVRLAPRNGGDDVAVAVAPDDTESADPGRDAEWFQAAMAGCRHALSLLDQAATDSDPQVLVTRLLTNLVDTTPDAVWTAAAKATAEALGAGNQLRVVFRDRWTVIPDG